MHVEVRGKDAPNWTCQEPAVLRWFVCKKQNRFVFLLFLWCSFSFSISSAFIWRRFSKFISCNSFPRCPVFRGNCSCISGNILNVMSCERSVVTCCFTSISYSSVFGLLSHRSVLLLEPLIIGASLSFWTVHQKNIFLSLYLFVLAKANKIFPAGFLDLLIFFTVSFCVL